MKAQNLRIGNYIKTNGFLSEIIAIAKNDVDYINVRNEYNKVITLALTDAQIEPILLNNQLLKECCGFDDEQRISAKDSYLQFTPKHNNHVILENSKLEPLIHFWDIKFLHQLQNLYFAVAGVELVIALNCLSKIIGAGE